MTEHGGRALPAYDRACMPRATVRLLTVVISVLTLLAGSILPAAATSVGWPDSGPFTVYMATPENGGSDSNNGLTANTPVTGLHRVHEVLWRHRPSTDVEIRIQPGTYIQPPMDAWRFYVPGHTVSFLPYDYAYGEGMDGIEARPVFRNSKCAERRWCDGAWITARPPVNKGDPLYGGGDSGLRFFYLTIERYSAAAISINGGSEQDVVDESRHPPLRIKGGGLDNNVIVGMVFRQIGNRWSGGHYGWGGIVLTDSSHNRIESNHFENIENAGKYAGYIHGIYITHFSADNLVRNNRFSVVSGDPIKVRNRSNHNIVVENVFRKTGVMSYFRDEFCGPQCARVHGKPQECPSYDNHFARNRLLGGYGKQKLPLFTFSTEKASAACEPVPTKRLRTGQNVTR